MNDDTVIVIDCSEDYNDQYLIDTAELSESYIFVGGDYDKDSAYDIVSQRSGINFTVSS